MDDPKAREAWLTELAWANGDADLQRGWWRYCRAELAAVDDYLPGAEARVIEALKQRRGAAA